jgi:hypothetical protein
VIDLFGTDTVSGLVAARTEIKCEGAEDHRTGDARRSSGESEPGDDHGDHGEEAGDDHGDNSGPGHHGEEGNGAGCTSADLVPGAVVHEADLEIEHGTATFDEVELAHTR